MEHAEFNPLVNMVKSVHVQKSRGRGKELFFHLLLKNREGMRENLRVEGNMHNSYYDITQDEFKILRKRKENSRIKGCQTSEKQTLINSGNWYAEPYERQVLKEKKSRKTGYTLRKTI